VRSCRDTRESYLRYDERRDTTLISALRSRNNECVQPIHAVVGARDDGFFTEHNRLRLLSLLGGLPARPSTTVNTRRSLMPEV